MLEGITKSEEGSVVKDLLSLYEKQLIPELVGEVLSQQRACTELLKEMLTFKKFPSDVPGMGNSWPEGFQKPEYVWLHVYRNNHIDNRNVNVEIHQRVPTGKNMMDFLNKIKNIINGTGETVKQQTAPGTTTLH